MRQEAATATREQLLRHSSTKHDCLFTTTPRLIDRPQIALAAVRSDGLALEFVYPQLRADRYVVTAAVTQNAQVW